MNIKKKRKQIIKVTVVLGVTLPILFALMSEPKGDGGLAVLLCLVAGKISDLISPFVKNRHVVFAIFIISHVATYLLLGWIIARLVYPNKKTLTESDTPSEPTQD